MGDTTEISWCDKTFNPWMGCTKVSPACQNCYAERDFDHRYKKVQWGPTGTRVLTSDANWKKPIAWNKEAESQGIRYRVFCASLADVFEAWSGPIRNSLGDVLNHKFEPASNADMHNSELLTMNDVRDRLFNLIDSTPNLDWMVLTKRPENIPLMWPIHPSGRHQEGMSFSDAYRRDNVWIGVSVENQHYADDRIPKLLKCRELSPVLFLSCEPLLGPVDLMEIEETTPTGKRWWSSMETGSPEGAKIDFVIVGGESGPDARPMNPDWVRMIRDQCLVAEVPFHFKQFGEWVPYEHCGSPPLIESQHGFNFDSHDLPEGIIDHEPVNGWYWPDGLSDVVYRRVGKKIAGRKLDGVTHDAFP